MAVLTSRRMRRPFGPHGQASIWAASIRAASIGAAALVSSACGAGTTSPRAGASSVVASFYPLQFVAERVGGERVDVVNLTPPGAEPHDLELTGQDSARLDDAQLVVYLSGFSPALDNAIAGVDANALDVAAVPVPGPDPHFWLDPTLLAAVADAVGARLSAIDPDGAALFARNVATLRTQLESLDREFAQGLANCASTDLVTSHAAFGYLARRYGLDQVGISGLSPEYEPSSADLAEIVEFVARNDVRTIYYETLVDPSVAETISNETATSARVLDPLEGLTAASAGGDYLEVMRSNLDVLRAGQGCS